MDSFLQVTKLLFRELVSNPQEHKCWHIHINIIHLLQQDSFSANDLNKLKKLTKRWKHLMVKLYGGIAEWQRVMSLKKKWLKKRSWMAEMVASDTMVSREKPLSFSQLQGHTTLARTDLLPWPPLGPGHTPVGAAAPRGQDDRAPHKPDQYRTGDPH